MSLRIAIAAIALVGLTAAPAPAQDFPTSPVRLVVGFAPGGGAVATDLLANQVQLTNFSSQMSDSYYPSAQVRGLMVLAAERSPVTLDIPSSAELGYEHLERLTYWAGLHAPKGTPPETIDKLHAAVVTAFENPELRERIEATGQTPVASTPAKFSERVRADYDFYGNIFEIADIPLQ